MTWNEIRRDWSRLKGKAKETWSRLSHRELDAVRGLRDRLVEKVRAAYGVARSDAERQVEAFARKLGASVRSASRKAQAKGRGALAKAGSAGRAAAGRLDRLRASVERGGRGRSPAARARRRTRS
jgi:uncharacterized protein YjbJ (UPF0337 family)